VGVGCSSFFACPGQQPRSSAPRRNRLTSHSSGRLRRRLIQALGLMKNSDDPLSNWNLLSPVGPFQPGRVSSVRQRFASQKMHAPPSKLQVHDSVRPLDNSDSIRCSSQAKIRRRVLADAPTGRVSRFSNDLLFPELHALQAVTVHYRASSRRPNSSFKADGCAAA